MHIPSTFRPQAKPQLTTMAIQTLLSFLLLLLLSTSTQAQSTVRAAYWASATEFPVSSINASLFTHLFCAFAGVDNSTFRATISPSDSPLFSSFTSTVRRSNPSVLTLLSIGGGGSFDPNLLSLMASQPSSRRSFIDSTIQLARSNGFLGLDLDWEYPYPASDMANLASLLAEWRAAIINESTTSGSARLLLTAAVYVSNTPGGSVSYPVSALNANLDWVNVMAYDFHFPTRERVTSAPAALYDPAGGLSGSSGVSAWLAAGLPAGKIVLGLPFYGYAWKLASSASHGLGAAATGPAAGSGIGPDGSIGFAGVEQFIGNNGATKVYNGTVVTNYCYAGTTWIGYDDVESVGAKVAYAKGKGLRGYFAWSVSGDDSSWLLSRTALSTWG